jgi:hypothetical protein
MAAQQTRSRWRGWILAVVAIPLVMLLCVGSTALVLDNLCYTALTLRLPIYPDAAVILEKHSGMRAFGMGETLMIIETDDPVETVRDWYGRTAGSAIRRMQQSGQQMLITLSDASYSVIEAEDGQGTQITLSGVCGG